MRDLNGVDLDGRGGTEELGGKKGGEPHSQNTLCEKNLFSKEKEF